MADQVNIELKITEFHDIRDLTDPKRFCVIDPPRILSQSSTGPRTPRVSILPGDPRTIRFNNGGNGSPGSSQSIDMTFTVTAAAGVPSVVVAGLIFNGSGLDEVDGTKKNNFDCTQIKGNTITIKNRHKMGKMYYEFFVAVQETSGSGRIGVIDPGVENSEDA